MNLQLNRKNFLSAMMLAKQAVAVKSALPIQSCFLLETKDNVLYITGYDGETRIKTKCPLLSDTPDESICIEAGELYEAINSITDDIVEVNVEYPACTIKYKKGNFHFPVQLSSNFPENKPEEYSVTSGVESVKLISLIKKIVSCVADDELRPVMNGIFVEIQDDRFIAVASDGHKLRAISTDDTDPLQTILPENSFILARNPAVKLEKLLSITDKVSIKLGNSNVLFYSDDFIFSARLIEGRFPNWRSVVPRDNWIEAILDRADFLDAIKRVSLTTNKSSSLLKLSFNSDLMGGKLTLSGSDTDFNKSSSEEMDCEYKGDPLEIGLKGSYLKELLSTMDCDRVHISLSNPSRAIVMRSEDSNSMLSLLMPMMLP